MLRIQGIVRQIKVLVKLSRDILLFFFLSPQLNAAGISVGSIVDCRFFD